MLIKAEANYIRASARKVRLVADMIRGKNLGEAKDILRFTIKKPAIFLSKLLNSAEANAKNNFEISPETLYVSKITVDEGPVYKRWMPRARGQAFPIQKKTSHITLVLEPFEGEVKKVESKPKEGKVKGFKKEKKSPKMEKEPKPKEAGGAKRMFRRKSI